MDVGEIPRVEGDERRAPLVRGWAEPDHPLPQRRIRGVGRSSAQPDTPPFDFCARMRALCADVARCCPELGHVDVTRILFAVTQARDRRAHGLQARVTPLRFRAGALTRTRRGVTYQVQRYRVDGRECLYVLSFCLPRFLDLQFGEKLLTVFHELYHVSPAFDGDLRRHGGRYSVHSRSQRAYDRAMGRLADAYLAGGADPDAWAFLHLSFAELERRHGAVVGTVVPRPKMVPVAAARQRR